jgi:hypothetical protein
VSRRAALIAIVLSACGPGTRAQAPPSQPVAAATAPAGNPTNAGVDAASPPDPAVVQALELVSRVRQLTIKRSVPGVRLDRVALRAEVDRLLVDETPPQAVDGNTEFLYAADTVRADFDLREALGLLLGAELAGFYDPKARRMVLAADLSRDAQDITLYHELVHALQDQHFDLDGAFDYRPDASDVQGALHALAEGDATNAMMDVFRVANAQTGNPASAAPVTQSLLRLSTILMEATPELRKVPGIVARSVMAPYADGLAFVTALRARGGGFAEVDRAFREPPRSTEQILHPEKYLAHEAVIEVPVPSAAPGVTLPGFHDVVGEQGLRLLFEEWAPETVADRAAGDWGGDRFAVYTLGADRIVQWHLVFDNEAAAERAELLFVRGALRPELTPDTDPHLRPFITEGDAKLALKAAGMCQNRAERGPFAVVRLGQHLGVTFGPYRHGATAVRQTDNCPLALQVATAAVAQR